MATTPELEQLAIDTIRALAMDGPEAADSGHQGTAMALAPLAHVLFTRVMNYDASEPSWPDRDRFVLSNGHAFEQPVLGGTEDDARLVRTDLLERPRERVLRVDDIGDEIAFDDHEVTSESRRTVWSARYKSASESMSIPSISSMTKSSIRPPIRLPGSA